MSYWFDKDKKRWRIRIRRGGLPVAETLPRGSSRAEAEERHAIVVKEHYARTKLGRGDYSLAEALDRLIAEALPPRSAADVLSNIEALAPWVEGRMLTEAAEVARTYRKEARKLSRTKDRKPVGPLSQATINRRLAVLRRACNLAWKDWGWLARPISIPLGPETQRHEYLTAPEVTALAKACKHVTMRRMIVVAAYTGMRWGEIAGLTRSSIQGGVIVLGHTKTGEPRRIPIVAPVRRALVVPFKGDRRWLYRHFKRAAKAIGKPGLRFHDLRHTTASLLQQAGVELHTIGAILGHASAQTTKRYAHLSITAAREALRRIV